MKKTLFSLLSVAAVATVVFSSCNNKSATAAAEQAQPSDNQEQCCKLLPIAYINVDTLLLNYELAEELREQLMRKQENSQANLNQKARQLESEAAEFQRKYENNAFLSQERAQSEYQRIGQKQQNLQDLQRQLETEFANEMQSMNERLRDSIYSYLEYYNQIKKYEMIFSNQGNDNIMLANPAYDITAEILEGLNQRYNPSSAKK